MCRYNTSGQTHLAYRVQEIANASSPKATNLHDRSMHKSLQHMSRDLRDAQDEVSTLQGRLGASEAALSEACVERDRCLKALEEAHSCVSDYHRKLGNMERTVGHALVVRGDLKELQEELAAAKQLSQQYQDTLRAAEERIEGLAAAAASEKARAAHLARALEGETQKVARLEGSEAVAERQARVLEDVRSELEEAQAHFTEVPLPLGCWRI